MDKNQRVGLQGETYGIDVTRSPEGTRALVTGEIDVSNAADLLDRLSALGGLPLVVDLSAVTFIDSSGLGALVALKDRLGGDVTMVVPAGSRVERVLDLAGLTGRFTATEGG